MRFILILLLTVTFSFAFTIKDEKAELDSMKREADAVCLLNESVMKITGKNEAELEVHQKFLIKNKDGDSFCSERFIENKFVEVDGIEAAIYDTLGNFIKEMDSDEIKEAEISPGYVFYSGDKYKYFSFTHNEYPFVYDLKYKIEYKSLFTWDNWFPRMSIPVLSASYKLILQEPVRFKYKPIGFDGIPEKSVQDEDSVYLWKLTDIPNTKKEDFMPPENKEQTGIYFAVSQFEIDNYKGTFESWDQYGKLYDKLTIGRYELPEEAKKEIIALVKDAANDKEKISILYKYLQEKTRYVAIEMGISGIQPQNASDVYVNHYGDCKDLSTYMIAMLKTIGIKAYPALALGRRSGLVNPGFVSDNFNHCIAVVPMKDDSIWLECTAKYTDLDDTPYNIQGINALVVDDVGGKLIKTPVKESVSNTMITKIDGTLLPTGNLEFQAEFITSGNKKNMYKSALESNDKKDNTIFLQRVMNDYYPNADVDDFQFGKSPQGNDFIVDFTGTLKKFAPPKGKRLFINPAIYTRIDDSDIPKEKPEERIYPVFYFYPYVNIDEVNIKIPDNYEIEMLPDSVNISNDFAEFSAEYAYKDGRVHYTRKLNQKKRIIGTEKYGEFLDFLNEVQKSDKSRIVFVKKHQ